MRRLLRRSKKSKKSSSDSNNSSNSDLSGSGKLLQIEELLEGLAPEMRKQAFTHSSWVESRGQSYERLAFLGDSVLGLAVSADIFPRFSDYSAGRLTKLRAQIVSGRACASIALQLRVPDHMREFVPDGFEQTVDALASTERVLASITEAIIGACYLEYGFVRVASSITELFEEEVQEALDNPLDFKSALQEQLAKKGKVVRYDIVDESGPPHERVFSSVAKVDREVLGEGKGRSKKDSEQEAARHALEGVDEL